MGYILNRNEFLLEKYVKVGENTEITDNEKKYIIAGDECYLRECLDVTATAISLYCPEKSREFIEKYSGGEYTVMLCHDK